MGLYQAWKFNGDIRVNNPYTAQGALAKITISWLPGMAADFKDLRFSSMGGQPLKYWIEIKTNSTSAEVLVELPPNATKIKMLYGYGPAVSESSISALPCIFYDNLESGSVSSSKWDTKVNSLSPGTVGIRTDQKYDSYSIGIDLDTTEGDSSSTYDQCHTLIKIALTALPVGTVFYIVCRARRWKTASSGGDFGGFGTGGTTSASEIYDIPIDATWHYYLTKVTRSATSTWDFVIWQDGTQVYSGSKTKTYTTYFNYGLQSRNQFSSSVNLYMRLDNVIAFLAGASAPALTLLNHYPAPRGAYLPNAEQAAAGLTLAPGYGSIDYLAISAGLTLDRAYSEREVIAGAATLALSAAYSDQSPTIEAAVNLTLAPALDMKYFISISSTLALTPAPGVLDKLAAAPGLTLAPVVQAVDTVIQKSVSLSLAPTFSPLKYYLSIDSGLTLAPTYAGKDYLNIPVGLTLSPAYADMKQETLSDYKIGSVDVSKTVTDAVWQLQTEIIGTETPPVFFPLNHDAVDHTGTSQHLFTGVSPVMDKTIGSSGIRTQVTAYDYSWYLAAQYIPTASRVMQLKSWWYGTGKDNWGEWIEDLLAGTGITAYKIGSGGTTWHQFIFQTKTTKRQAIEEISKFCGYFFEVKPRNYGTTENPDWRPCAYWVPETSIDDSEDGLDIPAALTLTWPSSDLADLPTIKTNPEERINCVKIIGTNGSGTYWGKSVTKASVVAGTELAIEYMEENTNLTTESAVYDYAHAMYDYFKRPAVTVNMRFIKRFDLQLYQKIKFGSGFPSDLYELTDGTDNINYLRIVGIKYHTEPANNYVDVTAVYDHPIQIVKSRHHRVRPNWITEMEDSIKNAFDLQFKAVLGTISSVSSDGYTAVVETETGSLISTRIK